MKREVRRDLSYYISISWVNNKDRQGVRDDIPDGETCVDLVKLVTPKVEVLFHARDVRIVEIGAVKLAVRRCIKLAGAHSLAFTPIARFRGNPPSKHCGNGTTYVIEKVAEAAKTENEKVDFLYQLALTRHMRSRAKVFAQSG